MRLGIGEIAVVLVGAIWILLAATWAIPAVLTIDGFVYHAMVDAFARNGSLFVENGLGEYGSSALRLSLMRDAGGQLAPQYPGGWGIVAAPAYLAGGLRGVIVMNAVASALTLALVWQAARALFADRALAVQAALIWGLATFAVDYAFGVWPHAVATCLVTAAVAAVATGWRGTAGAELKGALAAGLAIGLGLNIRVDALIAAVPLAVWLLGAGRRPYAALGMLLAGLAPGIAAATAINYAKFGIASPLTYGGVGGKANLGYYAELAPLIAVGAALSLAIGLGRVRAALSRPRVLGAVVLGVLAVALALPATRETLGRIATGFWILVVDFQAHPAPSAGLIEMPDGTIRMFGMVKKALLQSMPYAAAVIVVLPRIRSDPNRAAIGLCALFVGLWIVPFAFGTWHGGLANNMRYFLSLLPMLAILSAVALREIAILAADRSWAGPSAVLAVAGAAIGYAAARGYPLQYGFQSTLPNLVAGAIAALGGLTVLGPAALRGTLAAAVRGLFAFGLMVACLSGWIFDVEIARERRAANARAVELVADLPPDALVVTFAPAAAGFRVNRPPALTAVADFRRLKVGPDVGALVTRAFAEGRPVYVQGAYLAERMVRRGFAREPKPLYGLVEAREIYEVAPPAPGAGPQ